MKVTGQKVLITQETTDTLTEGGIVLPDQTVTTIPKGLIEDVGPDCKIAKKGNRVIINEIAGLRVEVNKCQYLLIEEEDILIILEEGEN